MDAMNRTAPKLVTSLPTLLDWDGRGGMKPGRGGAGWTVYQFVSAVEAAEFFEAHQHCAMPCWKRMDVIDGQLVQVR
jgi:hypothetical protein